MKTVKVFKYAGFGILGVAFVGLTIWLVMLLWNSLIPVLFHGPLLTYWQTAGLFLLSKIFLTGIAPGRHDSRNKKMWRNRYHEKYRSQFSEEKNEAAAPGA